MPKLSPLLWQTAQAVPHATEWQHDHGRKSLSKTIKQVFSPKHIINHDQPQRFLDFRGLNNSQFCVDPTEVHILLSSYELNRLEEALQEILKINHLYQSSDSRGWEEEGEKCVRCKKWNFNLIPRPCIRSNYWLSIWDYFTSHRHFYKKKILFSSGSLQDKLCLGGKILAAYSDSAALKKKTSYR